MTYFRVDPLRIYETPSGVVQLTCTPFNGAVANNQSVVASASGKRIRVMGWVAQSSTAVVGTMLLKSASGGTALMAPLAVPVITAGSNDKLPVIDSGYFETNTGEGLFCDVTVAAIALTLFYITYTP